MTADISKEESVISKEPIIFQNIWIRELFLHNFVDWTEVGCFVRILQTAAEATRWWLLFMEVEPKLRNRLEQFGKLMQYAEIGWEYWCCFQERISCREIYILHILQMSESQIVHGIYKEIKLLKWETKEQALQVLLRNAPGITDTCSNFLFWCWIW